MGNEENHEKKKDEKLHEISYINHSEISLSNTLKPV